MGKEAEMQAKNLHLSLCGRELRSLARKIADSADTMPASTMPATCPYHVLMPTVCMVLIISQNPGHLVPLER